MRLCIMCVKWVKRESCVYTVFSFTCRLTETKETKADCNRKLKELMGWHMSLWLHILPVCCSQDAEVRTCVCVGPSNSIRSALSMEYAIFLSLLQNFPCFEITFTHLEQNMDTVFSQGLQLLLLPLELLEKCPTLISDRFPDYKLVCWQCGKMLHLIFLSLIKIFCTKTRRISTPTVQTNMLSAFHVTASRFEEVVCD